MYPKLFAVIALAIAGSFTCGTVAEASDVDWKLYGSTTLNGETSACFFDLKGAGPIKASDGRLLRVWTKCLYKKDLDGINLKKDYDGKILGNAAKKMIDMYIPPIALVEDMNFDKATEIAVMEEAADIADIRPTARIFYELDCTKRMLRELSVDVEVRGKSVTSNSAAEWTHVAPETNGARLQKILCEKSVIR